MRTDLKKKSYANFTHLLERMKETALLPRAINGIKQLGDALVSQSSSKLAKAIGLEEPDGGDHELRDFAADNFMVVPGRVVHLRHLTSADPSHPTAEVREPTAFSEIKLSLPRMFTDHTPLSVSTARADGGGAGGGTDALVGCPLAVHRRVQADAGVPGGAGARGRGDRRKAVGRALRERGASLLDAGGGLEW